MWIVALALLLSGPVAPTKTGPKVVADARATSAQAEVPFAALHEPTLRDALAALGEPVALDDAQKAARDEVVGALRRGDPKAATRAWTTLLKADTDLTAQDINALIAWVLREAYLESTKDLQHYAAKVAHFNAAKRELRDSLTERRERVAEAKAAGKTHVVIATLSLRKEYRRGERAVVRRPPKTLALGTAEARLTEEEGMYDLASDLTAEMQLALQDALQKQQSVLEMMSNMSKSLHDTAKSIINNMKG